MHSAPTLHMCQSDDRHLLKHFHRRFLDLSEEEQEARVAELRSAGGKET